MANNQLVNFNLANPYAAELADIERRQRIAEMLQAQSQTPVERFSYNGIEARTSPLSGLAKALQGYTGIMMANKGREEQKALGERAQGDSLSDMNMLIKAMQGQTATPEVRQEPTIADFEDNPNLSTTFAGMKPEQQSSMIIPARAARAPGVIDPEMVQGLRTPDARNQALALVMSQTSKAAEDQKFQDIITAARGGRPASPENPVSQPAPGSVPGAMPQAPQQGPTPGLDTSLLAMSGNPRAMDLAKFLQTIKPEYGTKPEVFMKPDKTLVERIYGKNGEVIERPMFSTPYEKPPEATSTLNDAIIRAGVDPNSPQGKAIFKELTEKLTSHPKPTNVQNTVSVAPENEYNKLMGAGVAKDNLEALGAAQGAAEVVRNARSVRKALDSGAITGTGAESRLALQKALETAGIVGAGKAATTQELASGLAKVTLSGVKTSGLGAGNGFTDKDREFLQNAISGTIDQTPANLRRVADLSERVAIANHAKGSKVFEGMRNNPTLKNVVINTTLDPLPPTDTATESVRDRADAILRGNR